MKKHMKVAKTITLGVASFEGIDGVKDKYYEIECIGTNLENVLFTEGNFENGQVLDYEKKDGSGISMILHLGVGLQIFLNVAWSAKLIPLDVHSWDTITDVKTKFQDKEGTPANQLTLVYNKQLEDFQTLEAYHINNGVILNAILLGEDKIEISVRIPRRASVKLEVKHCSSVENVKRLLQCIMGFPIDNQKLYFEGELLENSSILADYGIGKDSILHFGSPVQGAIKIFLKIRIGKNIWHLCGWIRHYQ